MPFIKKMPAIEHFEVVLMFKTVKTPPTVKSPSPTLCMLWLVAKQAGRPAGRAADPLRPDPCVVVNFRRGELVHWRYGCGLGQARLLGHYTATGVRATSQLGGRCK